MKLLVDMSLSPRWVDLLKKAWPELGIVHVAKNGVEAAERIAALEPDFAFLDIRMPGLTGLEVAQGIEGATLRFQPDVGIMGEHLR